MSGDRMKLVYPEMETVLHFRSGICLSVVIENPGFFWRFIDDLYRQCCGEEGQAVLSLEDKPQPIVGNLDLLTNFFPFEINRKALLTKILAKLEKQALAPESYEHSHSLIGQIEKWLRDLAFQNDLELEFPRLSVLSLLKATGICLKEDYPSFPEKILAYMDLMMSNGLAKVFVLVNMRALTDDRSMVLFTDQCCCNGYPVLLVDDKARAKLPREERIIVDADLCEF